MNNFRINTFWSEKDNAFVAVCPEFEGLAVVGKTRLDAVKEAEAAIKDFIEIYQEDGVSIPEPTAIPEYSGQVRLRMSRLVHQKAAEAAETEGVSLNAFLSGAVECRLAVEGYHKQLLNEISSLWAASTVTLIQNQLTIKAETILNLQTGDKPRISKIGVSNVACATP